MNLLELLRAKRLLAIVRGSDREASLRAVLALVEEGVSLVEVSLTGRDALDVIASARAELGPDAPLGAGTVLTADDARAAREAGADFVVTPGLGAGLDEAHRLGLPTLAGALTPSEIIAARASGATAIKVFPADAMGGPRYLRALRGPFPDVPLIPVGGVNAEAARTYLAEGTLAIGVGSPLLGDAAHGGALDALRERARDYVRLVEGRSA
ncbi:bifunctional 4-hydroxy-2-oxoglutarate aldolase/2-dehydro-3-deoxy-phosphogluconate aldolase [Streptomyces triticirhizae]|uniref:Bifunctional 4-hydroxy-2-oxoglutarate aldolase/2-dehydro-3-deoxy-phosphogluconate aldolase n=1 Tax=Streptomyces triticirhizae TaxID=2483353 RepID=A0A3M2LXS7_9ACTN|nr:bifunctional 4-hydroxy-2-oxoglutarate aldolase/2-dehydro-3-deoxy-phosphogluconate aldolase [Streptomyces triticirhizae]RMI41946.1 bifunctional 4-hydroxy-2-oxoglutarate aldolase/2-dehydro-3-deoxy-phosphogluconate aldolase [Streptomyces triticirhizae]